MPAAQSAISTPIQEIDLDNLELIGLPAPKGKKSTGKGKGKGKQKTTPVMDQATNLDEESPTPADINYLPHHFPLTYTKQIPIQGPSKAKVTGTAKGKSKANATSTQSIVTTWHIGQCPDPINNDLDETWQGSPGVLDIKERPYLRRQTICINMKYYAMVRR
ncbi:hypothetical protein K439DRAFT_1662460 [Ramaria rubella]|nr:hypothetical protein K439DRAFT_1662460 [Ramaria rubella]